MRRHSRRRAAFTLVEVLAALVLAAIVLPVAMRGISLATMAASNAKHQMEAASLAEAKLAELGVSGNWQMSNLAGDCGRDWAEYRWAGELSDWGDNTLRQLTVSVYWTARGSERAVSLTTLVCGGSM
ncbi:MAG TPA: prepilin-type N-terminal cleavage/methylation domain-containing protein [Planctomycetota bacterium]|nr:prepilin-type N-terminal cleavage/methylation domain-containing protein [Planctomycetota bacterium]